MTSNQSDRKAPSELRRVVWLFAGLGAAVLFITPSALLSLSWWHAQSPKDLLLLVFPISTGLALGLLCSWDIWHLTVRKNPLWKDLLIGAAALAGLGVMILLRESGLWVWSFASGDALITTLISTIAVVSFVTERRKKVRVYFGSRTLVFIHARKGA